MLPLLVSKEAMYSVVNTTTGPSTLREIFFTSVPSISSIGQTNPIYKTGKWFIIVQKRDEN